MHLETIARFWGFFLKKIIIKDAFEDSVSGAGRSGRMRISDTGFKESH